MDGGTRRPDDIDAERTGPRRRPDGDAWEARSDAAEDTPAKPPMSRGHKLLAWLAAGLIAVALVAAGVAYWLHARQFESTDDAFIDANQSQVAAQVSGRVAAVLIDDNQHVDAGQVLLRLDPADYRVRLEQARAQQASAAAQVEQAEADLLLQQANLGQQAAQVRVAEADLQQAQQDLARYRGINPAAVSRQQFDQSSSSAKTASAKLDSARQAVLGGQAQLTSQQAKIDSARASLRQAQADVANAELQLGYADVAAPQAGRVTRRTVNLGNYVTPGQALLAVVPDAMWVTANFKETQLTRMQPGQPVEITVDTFPDDVLHGHVDSLQRGTGAVFSSLPAENATGNYVKVVQRVPVKIVFDGDDWTRLKLAPGLSVSPRVTVR